jgi:hypothetical protein
MNINANANNNFIQLIEEPLIGILQLFNAPVQVINDIQHIAENNINNRKQAALATDNPVQTFIDESITHTTDTQNVHDNAVLSNVKIILDRILEGVDLNKDVTYSMNVVDILKRNTKDQKVHAVLDKINNSPVLLTSLNMTNYDVLYYIYCRIYDPKNIDNQKLLLENLYANLADCYNDHGTMECATGIVVRIVSSLVLLDYDERNWIINKTEDYKNIIRSKFKLAYDYILENVENDFIIKEKLDNSPIAQESDKKKLEYIYNQIIDMYSGRVDVNKYLFKYDNINNITLPDNMLKTIINESNAIIEMIE